ncbi:MAG TPA: hypothetical protein VJY33_19510 [Isosphaeraceae bacterium]|jgi:hypothetical protein|nr:hypothetical protein [Isosphaeraceae bacterium]
MNASTRLEPLAPERARRLMEMLKVVRNDGTKALALDERGYATTVVGSGDREEEHLLDDLDVHA